MEKLFFYYALLFICLLLSSCNSDPSEKEKNQQAEINTLEEPAKIKIRNPAIISGVIREPAQKWITILHWDLITGKKSYTEPIDEKGNFQFSIDLNYAQDIYLYYTSLNHIFCAPGDSMKLDFNGSRGVDSLAFKGSKAKENDQIHAFLDLIDYSSLASLRNYKLDRQQFSQLADNYESACLSMIPTLNPEQEIAAWMDTYTRFLFAKMRFNYAMKNNIEPGDIVFNFLSELDSLGMDIKSCTEAYDLISKYYDLQLKKEDLAGSLQLAYDNDDFFTYARNNIDFVSEYPTDINKLALSAAIYPTMKLEYQTIDSLHAYYSDVVQNEFLSNVIADGIDNYKMNMANSASLTTLTTLSDNELVGDLFAEIMEKNKDKVIYFDFWGTSCKYCIEEFPSSAKLKKALEGKDIEFIYFCAPSDVNRQQKIIQRYNLEGQHYMLTRDQLKTLNSHFGFSALPRYMIVDKEGVFIDSNAKKPSSNKILRELSALAEDYKNYTEPL